MRNKSQAALVDITLLRVIGNGPLRMKKRAVWVCSKSGNGFLLKEDGSSLPGDSSQCTAELKCPMSAVVQDQAVADRALHVFGVLQRFDAFELVAWAT